MYNEQELNAGEKELYECFKCELLDTNAAFTIGDIPMGRYHVQRAAQFESDLHTLKRLNSLCTL